MLTTMLLCLSSPSDNGTRLERRSFALEQVTSPTPASTCCPGTAGFGRLPLRDPQVPSPSAPPRPGHSPAGFLAELCRRRPGSQHLGGGRTSKWTPRRPHPLLSRSKFLAQFCCCWAGGPLTSHFITLSLSLAREQASLARPPHEAVVCRAG